MKRILVIDDDEYCAEIAAGYLTRAGYEVVTAREGFTGLKLILSLKPDLILTDIWMPIGTGLSLAQRLRELGVNDVPIIFMTADHEPKLRDGAAALGVAAVLEKPFAAQELVATVASLLVRVRSQNTLRPWALPRQTRNAPPPIPFPFVSEAPAAEGVMNDSD
jgi:DNA-binding response OmpR family regulator